MLLHKKEEHGFESWFDEKQDFIKQLHILKSKFRANKYANKMIQDVEESFSSERAVGGVEFPHHPFRLCIGPRPALV